MESTTKFARRLEQLLYPPQCPFCGEQSCNSADWDASQNLAWCRRCAVELVGELDERCVKCGAVTGPNRPIAAGCRFCQNAELRFAGCVAIGNYGGRLQELVIAMKRGHDEILAFQLGRLLGFQLFQSELRFSTDWLIPMPTHWWRKFQRGFHAASVLTDGVRSITGNAKFENLLYCRRFTGKQGTLSTSARIANVRGAFAMRRRANIEGKRLILVDDVMTSGATASEAARILYRHGAASVHVAVVARGIGGL